MNKEFAILFLISLALLGFMITLFYRRYQKGKSWAMSIVMATLAFGSVILFAQIFFSQLFIKRPYGMGLEYFVFPIMTVIVTVVASGILGTLVYIFEHRKPLVGHILASDAAQYILEGKSEYIETTVINGDPNNWRKFACSDQE